MLIEYFLIYDVLLNDDLFVRKVSVLSIFQGFCMRETPSGQKSLFKVNHLYKKKEKKKISTIFECIELNSTYICYTGCPNKHGNSVTNLILSFVIII